MLLELPPVEREQLVAVFPSEDEVEIANALRAGYGCGRLDPTIAVRRSRDRDRPDLLSCRSVQTQLDRAFLDPRLYRRFHRGRAVAEVDLRDGDPVAVLDIADR